MKTTSTFNIVEFENPSGGIAHRVTGWLNGKRIRENYADPGEALTRKQNLEREAANLEPLPTITTRLTSEQVAEAEAGFHRIKGKPFSMTQAIDFACRNWIATEKQSTVKDAFDLFIAARKSQNARPATIVSLTARLQGGAKGDSPTLVRNYGTKLVHEIQPEHLRVLIFRDGSGLVNQDSDYRALTNFFNWCVAEKFCPSSPMATIGHIELDDSEPVALTLTQVRKLVTVAQSFKEGKLLPYVVLGMFCALRPREIERLRSWDKINLKRKFITIGADIAKMRSRRVVEIHGGAEELLAPHALKRTPLKGANWRKDWDKLRELAGLLKTEECPDNWDWVPDVLRHTGISYHFAMWQHEGQTAAWAGNSPDVIHKKYKGLVDPDDAKAFWQIGLPTPAPIPLPKPVSVAAAA